MENRIQITKAERLFIIAEVLLFISFLEGKLAALDCFEKTLFFSSKIEISFGLLRYISSFLYYRNYLFDCEIRMKFMR